MKSILLCVCLLSTLSATAQSVAVNTYAPPKQSTVLASTFVDWDALPPNPTANGQVRHVFDNPTVAMDKLEVHITTLNPGMESHPIHRHPWEEILLVKEGDFEVSVNGRKQHAGPGAMVFLGGTHHDRNLSKAAPNHSNRVVFDEEAMVTGTALYAAMALNHLRS